MRSLKAYGWATLTAEVTRMIATIQARVTADVLRCTSLPSRPINAISLTIEYPTLTALYQNDPLAGKVSQYLRKRFQSRNSRDGAIEVVSAVPFPTEQRFDKIAACARELQRTVERAQRDHAIMLVNLLNRSQRPPNVLSVKVIHLRSRKVARKCEFRTILQFRTKFGNVICRWVSPNETSERIPLGRRRIPLRNGRAIGNRKVQENA